MTLVIPKEICNYIEIVIGQSKPDKFSCTITEEQFTNWKNKCSIYNMSNIKTQKLFYKNLIMETIYDCCYYRQKQISYNIDTNKLVMYYKNTPIRKSEFTNKKTYTHEETHDTTHFYVDKNISIFFNNSPYRNIKITADNSSHLNRHKLYNTLQLFT